MTSIVALCVSIGLVLLATPAAIGQTFPSKPVRVLVGYQTGTGIDVTARVISQRLGEIWKQQVVVDNRPGANANIAAQIAAEAPPDGYTLLVANNGHVINPALYRKLPFDPIADFTPISLLGLGPLILVTHQGFPARSIGEVVSFAKANPGKLNFASAGHGSPGHLAGALFQTMARIDITHVPYKGAPAIFTDVISGQMDLSVTSILPAIPLVKAGRLRALAVTTTQRSSALPDVPSFAESGFNDFDVPVWYGLFGPRKLPASLATQVNAAIVDVANEPAIREKLALQGILATSETKEKFAGRLTRELRQWVNLVREAGIRTE